MRNCCSLILHKIVNGFNFFLRLSEEILAINNMCYSSRASDAILGEAGGGGCGTGDGAGAEAVAAFLSIVGWDDEVVITAGIGGYGFGGIGSAVTENGGMIVGAGGETGECSTIDCIMGYTGNLIT